MTNVWNRTRPLGFAQSVSTSGGIAAPLLAGFSLTAVIMLVTTSPENGIRYAELAVLAFALSAALLIYCVQFSAIALGFRPPLSERLAYFPEARDDPEARKRLRNDQWEETELWKKYAARAGLCYNLGLLSFLFGLGMLLVPSHDWAWERIAALVVIGGAVVLELVWALTKASHPKVLLPTLSARQDQKDAPDLPEGRWEQLFPDSGSEGAPRP